MNIMPYSTISYPVMLDKKAKHNFAPAFGGAKDIHLEYILNNHFEKLPKRIGKKVQEFVRKKLPCDYPNLKELHIDTYKGLLKCRTLEEAKNTYPEFSGVLDIEKLYTPRMWYLNEMSGDISLNLLKDYYGRLLNQNEIIEKMGLPSKQAFQTIVKKINFPVFPKNYRTLVNCSTEAGNSKVAAKIRAYNQLHPDLMYSHNKKAAQANKRTDRREAQSRMIKLYDKKNSTRKEKISRNNSAAWSLLPNQIKQEYKAAMSKIGEGLSQSEALKLFWSNPENRKAFAKAKKLAAKKNYGQR